MIMTYDYITFKADTTLSNSRLLINKISVEILVVYNY